MKLKTFTTFFLIMLFMEKSFSGTIRHDIEDKKYLEYGQEHTCVLKLGGIVEENGEDIKYYGSCTAINKRWVVTAAHVVKMKGLKKNFLILGEREIPIEKIVVRSEFDGSFGSADLALCKASEDLEISSYPELYEGSDELGKICGIAGYGKTGNGLTGANSASDHKRAGSNKVDAISDGAIYCNMSRKDPTELEFLISHGDSGGGLFIDGKLAGVNSSVLCSDGKTDSSYGDESCHTRVSRFKDWIEETVKED